MCRWVDSALTTGKNKYFQYNYYYVYVCICYWRDSLHDKHELNIYFNSGDAFIKIKKDVF